MQSAAYVRAISCLRPVIICLRPCNHLLLMALKRLENRPQNGSQTALKSVLGPLGELLELSWQPRSLPEAEKKALDRALAGLKKVPRQVSAQRKWS